LPAAVSEDLVVGLETRDDAAIFKISGTEALVQTLDFFTPIVDDPYTFGQIAAANALSDIYAMGGRPLTAMNMAGWPCKLGMDILGLILAGGRDKIVEAGAVLAGGHTVEDPEPKYGLSVTGLVKLKNITAIDAAKPGDALVLTKPIGVGILATALKKGVLSENDIRAAIDGMCALNDKAAAAAKQVGSRAVTDVTGFGLLGHLYNMARQSDVVAVLDASEVPVWPGTREAARAGHISGGAVKNHKYLGEAVAYAPDIDHVGQLVLCDPQTSGGLIIAVPAARAEELVGLLKAAGTAAAAVIGAIEEKEDDHAAFIRCV
jgi:selenide, water dikinase